MAQDPLECSVCHKPRSEVTFRFYSKGGHGYYKHQCRGCESKQVSRRASIVRRSDPSHYRDIEAKRQQRLHSYVVVYDPNGLLENGMFRGSEVRDSVRWGEEWVDGLVFRRIKDGQLYKAVGYALVVI